ESQQIYSSTFTIESSLCFLPASLPYKYFLIEKAKSWSEALDYCKERYSNLAIVRNAKDMEQLVDVSQPHLRKQVWIGLRYELTKWLWIQGEGNYVPAEFTMWAPGEPDDHEQGQENCVFARNGFWHDSVCSEEEYFVCSNGKKITFYKSNAHRHCRRNFTDLASVSNEAENEELKTLTAGVDHWISLFRAPWKWSDGSHMTFYRWNTTLEEPNGGNRTPSKTWSEALDYCRERYSDLAVVQNAEEMEQVVEVSQKYFQRRVWIGPRHEPSNWTWSGGRVGAEFEMWAEDEPNDHTEGKDNCVIARDGFWHDVPCSDEEHFACKSGKKIIFFFILPGSKMVVLKVLNVPLHKCTVRV
uniref:C-type lectin domain-containing protein n=1 Tax=Salarias fasciatus TaxID=181472 RepID=A0A672G275_SALFA